jgi:hypothetical protein
MKEKLYVVFKPSIEVSAKIEKVGNRYKYHITDYGWWWSNHSAISFFSILCSNNREEIKEEIISNLENGWYSLNTAKKEILRSLIIYKDLYWITGGNSFWYDVDVMVGEALYQHEENTGEEIVFEDIIGTNSVVDYIIEEIIEYFLDDIKKELFTALKHTKSFRMLWEVIHRFGLSCKDLVLEILSEKILSRLEY